MHTLLIFLAIQTYRIAFQETLLCREPRRRDSRANFDLTSCRETPLPSYSRSMRQKRESRIAFISKVDFVKEDPSMFCGDDDLKEDSVIYLYKDVKKLSLGRDQSLK